MRWLKPLICFGCCVLLFYGLNTKFGSVPPMGKFLDPFGGFWQNNANMDKVDETLAISGLIEPVSVFWDDRQVPHIFAANDHDLYLAQGYITARDRLWQMEFVPLFTAGRLSEILGADSTIQELDRYNRRLGLAYGAEHAVKTLFEAQETRLAAEAYTKGVNAFITTLDYHKLPVEYKILDYQPEKWTVLKTGLLLKSMAWNLTGRNSDRQLSKNTTKYEKSILDKLFPDFSPFLEPVIPKGTNWQFEAKKIAVPEKINRGDTAFQAPAWQPHPANGSNNWAVHGSRTASGSPILSNDMHLFLNLPAVWYECQLTAPGVNIYGVTMPGAPNVVVGFNTHISWGFTNATTDVQDWYRVEFQNRSRNAYRYNDEWHTTEKRVETIHIRGAEAMHDTVVYTHYGPVVYMDSSDATVGYAMRWTGHDPSNELMMFVKLNRAQNYEDYLEALKYFDNPAQNVAFASTAGDIALWHNGKFPLRWWQQGKYVLDGNNPLHAWQDFVPREHLPHVKNPARGFISSANQRPVDQYYPYYLGWDWELGDRAIRINEMLAKMTDVTPEMMTEMHGDVLNVTARRLLPKLLQLLQGSPKSGSIEAQMIHYLKKWDFQHTRESIAATIFEAWWEALYARIWRDEFPADGFTKPSAEVTSALILNEPLNPFFDDKTSGNRESLEEIVTSAFKGALQQLQKSRGTDPAQWQWGMEGRTNIRHVARIPGLGRMGLKTDGKLHVINATSRSHGPSWRMVVEMSEPVRAFGIYPGGQAGNPGSPHYDAFIDDWVEGRIYPLQFWQNKATAEKQAVKQTELRGKR